MGMKFIHLPKSKQFKIVTRFYDPGQETFPQDGQGIQQEPVAGRNEEKVSYGAGIKGSFRRPGKRFHNKLTAESSSNSNKRVVYLLIILMALFYFFLK